MAKPARATNEGFSKKSAGGYPQTASSGKIAKSAWASELDGQILQSCEYFLWKSPTVGLIWAKAIFTSSSLSVASRRGQQA